MRSLPPSRPARHRSAPRGARALVAAFVVGALAMACAGRAVDELPAGSHPTSGSASGEACFLRASAYDRSCVTDADCAFVPPGGNVCNVCANATGCLYCDLAAISAKAAPAYLAALKAALPAPDPSLSGCSFGGCPTLLETDAGTLATPACVAGLCTSSFEGCR